MTPTEEYLNGIVKLYDGRPSLAGFVLKHGQAFEPDELTFKGWRGVEKECFGNSTKLVMREPTLTYVEGFVTAIVPMHHAWVARDDGTIIDPTLRLEGRVGPPPQAYFGVPVQTDFLRRFLVKVRTYGVFDGMSKESLDIIIGKVRPSKFLAPTIRRAA